MHPQHHLREMIKTTSTENLALLEQINQHKPEAYKILYDRYYRILVLYVLRYIPQLDVAEDLVQDLFVTIWNKQLTFLSYFSFRIYLYNSVHNAALNYIKHQDIEQRYIEQLLEEDELLSDPDLHNEEIYHQLYQAIDELPPKCREIFLLHMEGKKNDEIAEILSIAVETVKTQKKRAMKYLKIHAKPTLKIIFLIETSLFS